MSTAIIAANQLNAKRNPKIFLFGSKDENKFIMKKKKINYVVRLQLVYY